MAEKYCNHSKHNEDVLNLIAQFAEFGATPEGGVHRLAASDEDKAARDFLCGWFEDKGFETLIDGIGNIFGVLKLNPDASQSAFFSGSHLDTQPNGGKFDGAVGVAFSCIAALAIKDLIERRDLQSDFQSFVVTCWTSEEGARFQPSLLGSRVFAGNLGPAEAWDATDADEIHVKDALDRIGYRGTDFIPSPDHYFETHIEQGTELESSGAPIGIVSACWGARKLSLTVTGQADHTGPTPMSTRRDALLAASKIILKVRDISDGSETLLHSSVGRIEVAPNSPNTVAEHVELFIEFRAPKTDTLDAAEAQLADAAGAVSKETGCTIAQSKRDVRDVVSFDALTNRSIAKALDHAGIKHIPLTTIAGHDAVQLQSICPSTLLFIPSRGGVTHSPEEFTSDDDLALGFDASLQAMSAIISNSASGAVHA